jgi:hypothetical protein
MGIQARQGKELEQSMSKLTKKDAEIINGLIESAHEPEWSLEAIQRIVEDCISNEERQIEEWKQYGDSRNLRVAVSEEHGAWIPLDSYKSLEQDRNEFRSYARWLAFMLAVSAISFAVLWGSR